MHLSPHDRIALLLSTRPLDLVALRKAVRDANEELTRMPRNIAALRARLAELLAEEELLSRAYDDGAVALQSAQEAA